MSFRKYPAVVAGVLSVVASACAVAASAPEDAIRQQLAEPRFSCLAPSVQTPPRARQQLQRFYQGRRFEAAWNRESLELLYDQLQQLGDDGLNPEDYFLHVLRQLDGDGLSGEQAACLDVVASEGYLQALHDLAFGRLDPLRVEPMWYAQGAAPSVDEDAVLLATAASGLGDLAATFDRARPSFPAYRQLRQAYAARRSQAVPVWPSLPSGPSLRPGADDSRVTLLRARLVGEGYLPPPSVAPLPGPEDTTYGGELVSAVKTFQQRHLLNDDGIVGAQTLSELNRTPAERMEQLRVNLERMRWLARQVEPTSVLVDVAGARITYFLDGQKAWSARVQVGRPERPTPLLKSYITHLTLNPTWTVPPTIWREDKLPAIRSNPGYLAENHMQVIDAQGNVLDPASVDWNHPGAIRLRQEAGPHNALGQVAIRFANPFAVYLHDTPSQRLFDHLPRTFSSGCVRVEHVTQLIDHLLAGESPRERQRIADLWASGETRRVDLRHAIPVLLAYWTVQAGKDGELMFRPDMYGLDAKVLRGLNAQPG